MTPLPGVALVADGVTKGFCSEGSARHEVLRAVSFEAKPGSLVLLEGTPGSGRSTLLRCLAGSYPVDAGSIVLRSDAGWTDLATASARAVVWLRQQYLSLFDGCLLAPPRVPVWKVVSRQCALEEPAAREKLWAAGFGRCADLPVGRLQGPDIRGVALAIALSKEASIYLLDEPPAAKGALGLFTIGAVQEALERNITVIATAVPGGPLRDLASVAYHLKEDTGELL